MFSVLHGRIFSYLPSYYEVQQYAFTLKSEIHVIHVICSAMKHSHCLIFPFVPTVTMC